MTRGEETWTAASAPRLLLARPFSCDGEHVNGGGGVASIEGTRLVAPSSRRARRKSLLDGAPRERADPLARAHGAMERTGAQLSNLDDGSDELRPSKSFFALEISGTRAPVASCSTGALASAREASARPRDQRRGRSLSSAPGLAQAQRKVSGRGLDSQAVDRAWLPELLPTRMIGIKKRLALGRIIAKCRFWRVYPSTIEPWRWQRSPSRVSRDATAHGS